MPTLTDATATDARALLADLAGPDAVLRDDQAVAIGALVDDRSRVLLVQRTGWGKSAVYWIATALRRRQGAGPTLVVSPLLALMRNQVEAARKIGLDAETVNSTNPDAWRDILDRLDAGTLDVLLISPERLNAASFRSHLAQLAPRIGLLVIDETHSISDAGHDFRPDYRRVRDVLDQMPAGTPVLACTATANKRVTADVADQIGDDVVTLRGRLGRDSLQLAVVRLPNAEQRLGWLAAFVQRHRPTHGRAGVIYTLTVDDADRTAAFLRTSGLDVQAYTSKLSGEERTAVEDDLAANRLDAVVATSALGMGYDKPDLAFVVHLGAPSSPVSYYQHIGRAGRAIDTAEVVLLPTSKDEDLWRFFDLAAIPTREETTAVMAALSTEQPTSLPALEQQVNARRTRMELLLKVLDVDGGVEHVQGGWVATGAAYTYPEERYRTLANLRRDEHAAMRSFAAGETTSCLMTFLAQQLDDDETAVCGRCQVCTGWEPPVAVDPDVVASARAFLRERDVPLFARRRWPSGLDEVKGNIGPARRPTEGRALAGGDDSGWGATVTWLLERSAAGTFDERYEELLAETISGLTRVLARWSWPRRPVAFVPIPSSTHGRLISDVTQRLAGLGKLPVVAALAKADGPHQDTMANGPHKAANALTRLSLTPAVADLPAGPIVLVDAITASGWTLSAAAWRLTSDAERPIYPLVLTTGR